MNIKKLPLELHKSQKPRKYRNKNIFSELFDECDNILLPELADIICDYLGCAEHVYEACKNGQLNILIRYIESNVYFNKSTALNNACAGGFPELVRYLLEFIKRNKYVAYRYIDNALFHACLNGKFDLIDILLKNGAEIRYGYYGAYESGNQDYIDYMKNNKGVYHDQFIIKFACRSGNLDIIKKFIHEFCSWDMVLANICEQGNIDIVEYSIKYLMESTYHSQRALTYWWNRGLRGACKGGHMDIINLMIKNGANDWDDGFEGACEGDRVDIAKLMVQKGATHFRQGLARACENRSLKIISFLIEKKQIIQYDWRNGLALACIYGHLDVAEIMFKNGATHCTWCGSGHKNITYHAQ